MTDQVNGLTSAYQRIDRQTIGECPNSARKRHLEGAREKSRGSYLRSRSQAIRFSELGVALFGTTMVCYLCFT